MVDDNNEYFTLGDSRSAITPEAAITLGKGLGLRYKRIAVVKDSSYFSSMIADAFMAGVLSTGAEIRYGGVCPAPVACAYFPSKCEIIVVVHGVMDRFKKSSLTVYGSSGVELSDKVINQRSVRPMPDAMNVGRIIEDYNAEEYYLERFKRKIKLPLGYAILDCGNNSTSRIAPRALEEAGASIISIDTEHGRGLPRGFEVEKKDVLSVAQLIDRSIGAVGILYNGDGTKFTLLNEVGDYVPNDFLLSLILMYYEPDPVVLPVDVPLCVEAALNSPLGIIKRSNDRVSKTRTVYRVKNSRMAVIECMNKYHAEFGALLDGTFFFSGNGYCPDGIYGSAIILQLARDRSVRNILSELGKYKSKTIHVNVKIAKTVPLMEEFIGLLKEKGLKYEIINEESIKVLYGKNAQCIVTPEDTPGVWKLYGEANDSMFLYTMLYSISEYLESFE